MATKITYADKVSTSTDPSVAEINKITDDNLNEIKARFNELVDELPAVIDNLQSQSSVDALSANQGRVIQNKIVELEEKVNSIQTIVNKLNSNLGDLTVEVVDEW